MSALDKPSKAERILRHFHLWGRRAATLFLLLLVVAIGTAVYVWTSQSGLLAAKGAAFLNAHVFGPGTHVVVGGIRGTAFNQLILEDVRLEGQGPGGDVAFLSAQELEVSYDLWGILHGRYVATNAAARGLHLEFLRREGGFYLPTFRGGKTQHKNATTFRIEKIMVVDGTARIELPWRTVSLDSLNGELSVESGPDGLRLSTTGLRGSMNDQLGTVELDQGMFVIEPTLRLDGLRGRWSGSPFQISGTVAKKTDFQLEVESFPLGRLGKFLQRTDLDPGYVTRLAGTLSAEPGRATFQAEGAVSWQEWVGDHVQGKGTVVNDVLNLEDLSAHIEGATLDHGSIWLPLHGDPFTVHAVAQHLNTATLRMPVFDQAPGILNGTVDIRFGDRKDFLRSMDLRARLAPGEILDVPFQSGVVSAVVADSVFRFDSLAVAMDGARAAARGKAGPSFLDLVIDYAGTLVPLRTLTRQPDMSGSADLHARLNGPPVSPLLIGSGEVRQFSVADLKAPRLVIEEAAGPVNEHQSLRVRAVTPEGLTISNLAFARGFVTLVAAQDSARVDSVAIVNPDTLVTGHGSVRWTPDIRVSIQQVVADAGAKHFQARAPFTIYRRGDVMSTPGLILDTARGSARVEGEWNLTTHAGRLLADLHQIDPSVFFPTAPPIAVGKVNGVVDVEGSGGRITGHADLGLREVDWQAMRAHLDSVQVTATLDDRVLKVDRLMARHGSGKVEIQGWVGLPESIVPAVQKLREHRYPDPEATKMDLQVAGTGIDLTEWKFLMPPSQSISGLVDVTGKISGSSAHPEIQVQAVGRGLNYKGFEADSVTARGSYAAGAIGIEELMVEDHGQSATVRGSFPLDLTMLPFSAQIPERPMDLHVEALDGSLHGLEFTPWIKKASGSLHAEVRVGGTLHHPLADGWARVEKGRVEIRDRDEVVENISAQFAFTRDKVKVEEAKGLLTVNWAGNQLSGGTVSIEPGGTYRLAALEEQSYRMKIKLDQVLVGQAGTYAGRVSGSLDFYPFRAPDGRIYPFLKGDLFASRIEYAGSLKPQDIAPLEPPGVLYDVKIDAPQNILINTEQTEAVLGGELTARQTPERQEIIGTLDVQSGSYQFLQKTFRVTQGTLTWDDPASRIPKVNIQAETKDAGYLITVTLTGPADQVEIHFTAENLNTSGDQRALSDNEILSLLALGSLGLSVQPSTDPGQPGTTPDAKGAAAGFGVVAIDKLFGGSFERQLQKQLGINAQIEYLNDWNKEENTYVPKAGVSTYLTNEIRLEYLQGITRTYEQDVALEYRLRKAVVLRGSVINIPGKSSQEYNLELKLHHDY
jgi:translocation-and-assembly-module (TAM) inner membrane subunit TamB-like protein